MSKIGDLIYVGGSFSQAGGINANKIARYNTLSNEWSAIGNGIDGGSSFAVTCIVSRSPTEIYVGGNFVSVGGLATPGLVKLDPTTPTWTSLSDSSTSGLDWTVVNALVIANNKLYVGGVIGGTFGQVTINSIIAYDFTNGWEPVGLGFSGTIFALATDGFTVFAGGYFTNLGDGTTTMNYISQWDGSSWTSIDSGADNAVWALTWSSTTNMLFAAGDFTSIGGVSAKRIAGWNGNDWVDLAGGLDNTGYAISTDGMNVFVTGQFSIVGGTIPANKIAQWNGAQWFPLESGISNGGRAILLDGSKVYVGGLFTTSGDVPSNRIASFTCSQPSSPTFPTGLPPTPIPTPAPTPCWQGLGQETLGTNADIYAMSKIGDLIYVGGEFTSVDGITANRIARYNTLSNEWSAIGDGIGGGSSPVVTCIVSRSPTEIYVGGRFSNAGSLATPGLVKLDPTTPTWTSLYDSSTTGLSINIFYAMVIANNKLYIGGFMSGTVNQAPIRNIIAYDFTNGWESVGLGFNTVVYALATDGFKIFAGGIFTTLGDGTTMQYISQWDGSSWSEMGSESGTNSAVWALTWSSTTNMLFAIGFFTTIGGTSATRVAGWNGNNWIDLGGGLDDTGYAISTDGVNVFVAGGFSAVAGGTIPANKIVQWNGAQWLTLGSGLSGNGYALVLDGSKVYVGGSFLLSGDVPSNRIASFTCAQPSSPTFPTGLPPTPLPTPAPCWQGLGLGTNAEVLAMSKIGDLIYVGGSFNQAGGITANKIARYNTLSNEWSAIGDGIDGGSSPTVNCIVSRSPTEIYVGGRFSSAGSLTTSGLVKLDPTTPTWTSLYDSSPPELSLASVINIYAMVIANNKLYVGGVIGGTFGQGPIGNIIAYDFTNGWEPVGLGFSNTVYALATDGFKVFAGGAFIKLGDGTTTMERISQWDGSSWTAIRSASGTNNIVLGLTWSSITNMLFAAGLFTTIGGIQANRIAGWNGNNWIDLGGGLNNGGYAVSTIDGVNVFVTGAFAAVAGGTIPANKIAQWNGAQWLTLGSGISNTGDSLLLDGSKVYVGGSFTTSGDVPSNNIASFTCSQPSSPTFPTGLPPTPLPTPAPTPCWQGLGQETLGANSDILVMSKIGDLIYVGGSFDQVGGITANKIARYNTLNNEWSAIGNGIDGGPTFTVKSIVSRSPTEIYVAGRFPSVGGLLTPCLVKLDPTTPTWTSLYDSSTTGLLVYNFNALVIANNKLYIGGFIGGTVNQATINSIIAYDFTNGWEPVGLGFSNTVYALATDGFKVFAGGIFTTLGDGATPMQYISQWDGSSWSAMGSESGTNSAVWALTWSSTTNMLFAIGFFTTIGGVSANRIAGWNGNTWIDLGGGLDNTGYAISTDGVNVFVAGAFGAVAGGTIPANRIAQWNGAQWFALGSGISDTGYSLLLDGSKIYVGGLFTTSGDVPSNRIASFTCAQASSPTFPTGLPPTPLPTPAPTPCWQGLGTTTLGTNAGNSVRTLLKIGDLIYVGGAFTSIGGVSANSIARYNTLSNEWSAIGDGIDGGSVYLIVGRSSTEIYVGGNFLSAGNLPIAKLVKLDPTTTPPTWSSLYNSNTNGVTFTNIYVLLIANFKLYIGGQISGSLTQSPSPSPINNIIAYDFTNGWQPVGSGFNLQVTALETDGDKVFAGGLFTALGDGTTMQRIAQWNGLAWTSMGLASGTSGSVYGLVWSSITNMLFATGDFTTIGGVQANRVAKWNGNTWIALGNGLGVNFGAAISTSDGVSVFVTGSFASAGAVSVNNIAQWNGVSWVALGSGLDSQAAVILADGSSVYVGGFFTNSGGITTNKIAKFNCAQASITPS